LSLPLLNKEMTKGIITIKYICGGFMCGGGKYILLSKTNGKWKTELNGIWYN